MPPANDPAPLPPDREAAVRRLLADAAGPEPVPSDVAERLDARLAELQAERSATPEAAQDRTVVDLASRRRRRLVTGLFVAAAAVVAVGIGTQLIDQDPDSNDVSAAVQGHADRETAPSAADSLLDGPSATSTGHGAQRRQLKAAAGQRARAVPRALHRRHLRDELIALQSNAVEDFGRPSYRSRRVSGRPGFTCAPSHFGRGVLLGVRYDGAPAVVAFREPVGSNQVVEVLRCGTGDVLRSVTLPAPH